MFARWPRPSFYIAILLVIVLDQLTKVWAATSLFPLRTFSLVPGFFNLTYVQNRGIAFGMFQGEWVLMAIFVVGLVLAALYYTRGISWSGWEPNLVGGCLCGGALGNLADRMRLGYVIDFFDVHISAWHLFWPVFNVADSFICVSVAWLVLRQLIVRPKPSTPSA